MNARLPVRIAVLAFALRAFVPMGYMWAPVGGQLSVVACSDYGADVISLSAHRQQHHHPGGRHASGSACPFALAGGAALAANVPAFTARHYEIVKARLPAVDQCVATSIPFRYCAPRGPPVAV